MPDPLSGILSNKKKNVAALSQRERQTPYGFHIRMPLKRSKMLTRSRAKRPPAIVLAGGLSYTSSNLFHA